MWPRRRRGDIDQNGRCVATVKNDLEVVTPSKREAVEEKDAATTKRV